MGTFYFDESMHDDGGFILGAFVYTEQDIEGEIRNVFKKLNLNVGIDEFKSSVKMAANPNMKILRKELREILLVCRIAVVVIPKSDRKVLGYEAFACLLKVLKNNKLLPSVHDVYFDEEIFGNLTEAQCLAKEMGLLEFCRIHFEQNSKHVLGIQLADLAAHSCATMLREEMGIVTKTTKAGDNSGYDPDTDISIGFELWTRLRHCFFSKDISIEQIDEGNFFAEVEPYGLYIAPSCDEKLHTMVIERFGKMHLGCIF